MSSPQPLRGALAGFILVRFLVFYIIANRFPNRRTARTWTPDYSHVTIDYIVGLTNEQQINVSHLTSTELELIHQMLYYFEGVHEKDS